jgi:hypothetical protein
MSHVQDLLGHLTAACDLARGLERDITVTTPDALRVALATAPAGAVVRLAANIDAPLTLVPRSGSIILDGHGFTVPSLKTAGPVAGVAVRNLVVPQVSIGDALATSIGVQPRDVTLENLTVIGNPQGQKRGVALHGINLSLVNSRVRDMKLVGQDSQALWINNGPGPYTVANCVLEGAGENVLVGGDTIRYAHDVASDILFENCHLVKPLTWKGAGWQVKNSFELKQGRRVTIRGCTIENCWAQAQTGYAVLFTDKDQYGASPWAQITDVLMEDCELLNVSSGFKIAWNADGYLHPASGTQRITLRRVTVHADKLANGGDGRFAAIGLPIPQLTMEDCVGHTNGGSAVYFYQGQQTDGIFRRNRWVQNTYGFYAAGVGTGTKALAPAAVWEQNTIVGGRAADYPAGTLFADAAADAAA